MPSVVATFSSMHVAESALRALRTELPATQKVRVVIAVEAPPAVVANLENLLCRFDPLDLRERREDVARSRDDGAPSDAPEAIWSAYDDAVARPEGPPDDTVHVEADIAARADAEDRYDEDSGAGPGPVDETRRGIAGFGRSLGLQTSHRPPTPGGDSDAHSDLSLSVAPEVAAEEPEELEGSEDQHARTARSIPEALPRLRGRAARIRSRTPATTDASSRPARDPGADLDDEFDVEFDVELDAEVMHQDASPEGVPRPERADRGPTGERAADRREGAEPDDDRLPSPSSHP